MNYLQVTDPWLARAAGEFLQQRQNMDLQVTDAAAQVKVTVGDNNLALLWAGGHEIDNYELPLRLQQLMADVIWQIARQREDAQKEIQLNNNFILQPREFRVSTAGIAVALTGREVALLQHMLHAGECSKEDLLSQVWRYHPESATHTVETHLWRLRQKLQQAGIETPLIVTTDRGYRIA